MGHALERCVGDRDRFLAEHWDRAPLHRSGSDPFDELLSLTDIDSLLTERGLRFPALRMVKEGKTLPPSGYTKRARIQSRDLDDLIDARRVYELFGDGATIVLQAVHRHWTPLSHFCRDLETELTHPIQVNVYLTPPVSQGLDIHYDTHDVFVLQVAGVKRWKVWRRGFDSPLAHHKRTGKYEDPGPAQIDVELKPGDSLYIPRGYLHAAQTLDRESAHMTVGILNLTWIDILERLMQRAESTPTFRGSLPPGFANDPASLESDVRTFLSNFGAWVSEQEPVSLVEETAERFWNSRAPVLVGQLQQILDLDALSEASTVRRRRGSVLTSREDDGELRVLLGGRTLAMPLFVAPAIDFVRAHQTFAVADLAPYLDREGRLVLVRRLIREGLLEQTPGG